MEKGECKYYGQTMTKASLFKKNNFIESFGRINYKEKEKGQ